ncbi:hypothetical protein QTG54_014799 [Skeletonema marinoi]|uniref:Uncharacterized protein n=1 Tax=Skeletonema marinoi TaxID=267567 RepID=A0AAD8XWD6_9STRA|nr:hypothetical protein QTG54_014799 [Skeletonema marinoi]
MMHPTAPSSRRMITSCIIQRFKSTTTVNRSGSTTATYYDSQSGQHVAIHDESKITAYLRTKAGAASSSFASVLKTAKEIGLAGSIIALPHQQLQQDVELAGIIQSLDNSSGSSNNDIFLHMQPSQYNDLVASKEKQLLIHPNINLCFEYNNNDGEYISNNVQSAMTNFEGIQTSIGIFNPTHLLDDDPMLVAAKVASMIDITSEFGGTISNILVAPIIDNEDAALGNSGPCCDDELVQLCEELTYLDVPGSTIKSRLVVSALSGDQLEECLQMGITKYIIDASDDGGRVESRLDMLRDVVEESGKELVLDVMR